MKPEEAAGPESIAEALGVLCERYRLVAIYAFGSRAAEAAQLARGRAPDAPRPSSDLDIGVLPDRGVFLSVRDKVDIAIAIEDLFDVARVDLVALPDASAFLARDIVCGEVLCARDPRGEARYQLYALRRAADLLPYARRQLEEWLDGESVIS